MTVKTYTLEIGGVERAYLTFNYEDKLDKATPSRFDATIKYYADIEYFDLVEIKCNGTTEWKGFLEDLEIDWKGSGGRKIFVGGRDNSIIVWKKWCENFSNFHEGTSGFFGRVNASKLLQFILRCPKSDLSPTLYPFNKSGWGLDNSKLTCSAIVASPNTRYQTGYPQNVVFRKNGYGWRNSGNVFNTADTHVDTVESIGAWSHTGASPYIDTDTGLKYINSNGGRTNPDTCIFTFENLSSIDATASSINRAILNVKWKPEAQFGWWALAETQIYLSPDAGTTWYNIGKLSGRNTFSNPTDWVTNSLDVSGIVTTVAEADAMKIKFVSDCGAYPLYTYISRAYISYSYAKNGNQQIGDEFDITFPDTEVMGIYFESRYDEDSYPRNYGLVNVGSAKDLYSGFVEVDPNSHISKTTTHLDFDCYNNETAYTYKDNGVGGIGVYFDYYFRFKVVTDPVPTNGIIGIWGAGSTYGEMEALHAAGLHNIILLVKDIGGAGPKFYLREVENGAEYFSSPSIQLGEGTEYTIRMVRRDDEVIAFIYNDENLMLFDTINLTLHNSARTYRYLMACLTANTATNIHTNCDFDDLYHETYTSITSVSGNIYRDVIESWNPTTMNHIRIRISSTDAHAWCITQLYIYAADTKDYRVCYEGGTAPTYSTDQYIRAITIDDSYVMPIGPLNVAKGRLSDAIQSIVDLCHTSYVPFEYWLDVDSSNTFHLTESKGTDVSGTVSFVKGTHIGGVSKVGTVSDTVQRVQVVGKGEGKIQDDVSSDWQESSTGMSQSHTWFEDIITEKTVINKDIANMLARIHLTTYGVAHESLEVIVNNDEAYAVNAYKSGDTVGVTDSLTGTYGTHRIFNIRKTVDGNGADITVNLDSKRVIPEEALKDLYNKIKQVSIAGTVASDWGAEETDQKQIDADKALTSIFSQSANNDDVSKTSIKDATWYRYPINMIYVKEEAGTLGSTSTPAYYKEDNVSGGVTWAKDDKYMKFTGRTRAGNQYLLVEMRDTDVDGIDEILLLSQNPKLTAEIKLVKNSNESGISKDWHDGDYFVVGLYNSEIEAGNTTGKGYTMIFQKEGSFMNVYCSWNENGLISNIKRRYLTTVSISDIALLNNYRYKVEIITNKDNRRVTMNLYDLSIASQKYPISMVIENITLSNVVRKAFFMLNSTYATIADKAQVYIYNVKTEVLKSTVAT